MMAASSLSARCTSTFLDPRFDRRSKSTFACVAPKRSARVGYPAHETAAPRARDFEAFSSSSGSKGSGSGAFEPRPHRSVEA
jgi:hypothetical protein